MTIFTDSDMQAFRDLAAEALRDDCLIQRDTAGTPDDYGTDSEGLTTVATVKCLTAAPTAGQLATYAEKIGNLSSWQVRMPFGTSVLINDGLTIDGQTMRVQADLSSEQTYAMYMVVLASEVL